MTKKSYQILKVLSLRYFSSFNKNSRVNLFGEKSKMKLSGVYLFLRECVEKKIKINASKISFSLSFSYSNLKVSIH